MNLSSKYFYPKFTGIALMLLFLVSCEKDLTTVGVGVVGSKPFSTGKEFFDVFAYNKNVKAVQTNRLPVYQLGTYSDPIYGKTNAFITSQIGLQAYNPSFGVYSQSTEDGAASDSSVSTIDEQEQVKEVYLYIPYLTRTGTRDTDQDGVEDEFDSAPEDASNDSDGDGVSNIVESAANTDPLDKNSVDANGDGLNDTDGKTIHSNNFAKRIELDSMYYGTKEYEDIRNEIAAGTVNFHLKMERSTYYLRDLDPNTNFTENQAYYSNQEFSPSFVSDVLYDGNVVLSDKEILIQNKDDATTEDVDESQTYTKKDPGIWVPLNADFFQDHILDKEGSSDLLSRPNFIDYLRGMHFSLTTNTGIDMLMLLDITKANITMTYTYKKYDANSTAADKITTLEKDFIFSFLTRSTEGIISGNAVNTFVNEDYPSEILTSATSGENASRIFLKGGAGIVSQINLFESQPNARNILNQIKKNNWVINEANLVFYVDRERLDALGASLEPPRLYVYNVETNRPLYNVLTEYNETGTTNLYGFYQNYGGLIEKSGGKGVKYSVRITEHINNLIIRDSTNATLGVVITADIANFGVSNALMETQEADLPRAATLTPLGTVVYGPNLLPDDPNYNKRLKLEINYTKID